MADQPVPTNVAVKQGRKFQLYDGAGVSIVFALVQDVPMIAYGGDTVVEAMHRGEHLANPIVIRTADTVMTGSASFLLAADYFGNATDAQLSPYTWMFRQTAQAAGLVSTTPTSMAVRGAWCFGMRIYDEATNSTKTYRFVNPEKPTQSLENDLLKLTFNFTDYENVETVTSGDGTL